MHMEDLYRLLRASDVQAQGIVDTVPDPMLVLDQALCVQGASRSFFETFKVDRFETIGQPLFELGNGQWDIPDLRRLLDEVIPKSSAIIDYKVEQNFPDLGRRTMLLTARTLYHPDNSSHSLLLSIVDATERYRQDAAKDMLFDELRHRMKNLLAVAQSIAQHTATEGRSAEEYRDDFLGRFGALAEAQDLAFSGEAETAVKALAERILAPYGDAERIVIECGAPAELSSRTISSLGLVLHELATNAAKYGALSQQGGQVRITCDADDANNRLRIQWVESGGPPVKAPARTSFGTRLIESTITYSLGGQVKLDYAQSGLQAEIVIPLGSAAPPD